MVATMRYALYIQSTRFSRNAFAVLQKQSTKSADLCFAPFQYACRHLLFAGWLGLFRARVCVVRPTAVRKRCTHHHHHHHVYMRASEQACVRLRLFE